MMKDEQIMEEVIFEHKKRVSMVFSKFYRLLKSIKRDLGSQGSERSAEDNRKPVFSFFRNQERLY